MAGSRRRNQSFITSLGLTSQNWQSFGLAVGLHLLILIVLVAGWSWQLESPGPLQVELWKAGDTTEIARAPEATDSSVTAAATEPSPSTPQDVPPAPVTEEQKTVDTPDTTAQPLPSPNADPQEPAISMPAPETIPLNEAVKEAEIAVAQTKERERLERERLAQLEAERQAKQEAQRQAELEAERQAKLEAERQAQLKAEREAREEAERQAKLEAARQAKLEAERKAKEEAQRQAELEAERQAKLEAERQAQLKAEREAREEAERQAKLEAARQAKLEAERKAKEEAQRQAELEAERQAKLEAEKQARLKAELEAREEAEKQAKLEAARQAKLEAERKAKEEAQRQDKLRADKEAKEKAAQQAKLAAEKKAKEEEAARKAKLEAQRKAEAAAKEKALRDAFRNDVLGATGIAGGTATKNQRGGGADAGYAGKIRACIQPNVSYPTPAQTGSRNPTAQFRVQLKSNGSVSSTSLRRSSGNTAFDRAVENGIRRCSPFPKPPSGRYPSYIDVNYRMYD